MRNFDKDEAVSTDLTPEAASADNERLSRRSFFKLGGAGALGIAIMPTAGMALLATSGEVYAQNFTTLGDGVGKTLVKLARDIFPHDTVPDKFYAAVIASYDQQAADEPHLKALMDGGVQSLDAAAIARFGKPYAEIAGEGDRVVLLYAIEQTPFFQKVRGDLVSGLYNNKEIFPLFGYEGSSWEKGGYLDRGFGDIDWL